MLIRVKLEIARVGVAVKFNETISVEVCLVHNKLVTLATRSRA